MDWSIIGREAKKALKDVIDQSFGTHFFGSSTPVAQPNAQSLPTAEVKTDTNGSQDQVKGFEELKAKKELELKQQAEKDRVRMELEEAIARQRQKRISEQDQVEQIRQETLQKSETTQNKLDEGSGAQNQSRNLPTKEQLDAVSKE